MKSSFSLADIGNIANLQQQLVDHTNLQIIGNQVVARNQKQRLAITKANKLLNDNRSSAPITSDPSTLTAATFFLETIGCTITTEKTRNFSFQDELMNEKDGEIENPNIDDRSRLRKLRNKQIETTEVYSNPSDPFYELDSEISRKQQLQNKNFDKMKNRRQIIKLAADLSKVNLRRNGRPLKYFT